MLVATGKVVDGKVVVEGATVTILAPEDAETFEVGPEEETALLAAIAEADRGDFIEAADILAKLSPRG